MDALRSYLTTAILASVVSAICIQITEERFRKYVKFIVGLCLLSVLALPLVSLVREISEIDLAVEVNEGEIQNDDTAYLNLLGSQIAESIGDRIARQYDIPREAVYVTLTLDTADPTAIEIDAVEVTVTEACDEELIERSLSAELACTAHVREEVAHERAD